MTYTGGRSQAETRFNVVSAEGGITKEISFPYPLGHPLMGGKRSLDVIKLINMVEISVPWHPTHGFTG
jgi:hypothetical protein